MSLQNLVGVSLEVITPQKETVRRLLAGAARHIADAKVKAHANRADRCRSTGGAKAFGQPLHAQVDRLFVVLPVGNGSPKGRVLSRWPVAAKIALANAGATGGTPISPTPPSG